MMGEALATIIEGDAIGKILLARLTNYSQVSKRFTVDFGSDFGDNHMYTM